jgi:hypothetical protein
VTYDDLCTAIVQKHMRLLGTDTALAPARKVGITIDDDGKAMGTTKELLGSLVDAYTEMTGRVTLVFTRGIVAKLITNDNLDLPDNLR